MAETRVRLTDTESSSSDRRDVNTFGLAFDEISEEKIQEEDQESERQRRDKTDALCDVCLMHNLIVLCKNLAFYLCYVCERYLCEKCFKGHESHTYIKLVSEKSERETRERGFLGEMRKERKRKEKFERENVAIVDKVNVKHRLDRKDFEISGLCGLDNTLWVVSDHNNDCIKIFNVGSNLLQRYIRLGSNPWGVTEIKLKSESTEQGVMSAVDISVMNKGKQVKQCLLAVTLPWENRILIIDVTQNPAVITKAIKTEKKCWSIDFSGDHLVTLCSDDGYDYGHSPMFISVISIDGVRVKNINTDYFFPSWSHLAACSGRFYITVPHNHKVLCLNDEGEEVTHKTIEESWPAGISVDPDTYHVYICAQHHHKMYRLNSSLESLEPLFDFESVNSEEPWALCLHRDKLYVSHWLGSTHQNVVTVVRVL